MWDSFDGKTKAIIVASYAVGLTLIATGLALLITQAKKVKETRNIAKIITGVVLSALGLVLLLCVPILVFMKEA